MLQAVFQKGAPDNPDILMAYLRGEDVDALLKPRRDAAAEKEAKKGSRGQNTSPKARAAQAKKGAKNSSAAQAEKGREGARKNSSATQAEKGRKNGSAIQAEKGGKNSSATQAEKGRKGGRKRKFTHPDCNPDCAECLQQGKFPCSQCRVHQAGRMFDPASWERKARNHVLVCCDCNARTTRKSRRSTKK